MKKEGFTLIELLAVIVILSSLGILVGISVTKLIKDSREKLSNIQLMSIEESVKVWSVENVTILPKNGECIYMTLGDLKVYGLVDEEVIDAKTSEKLSDEIFIKIIGKSSKYNKLTHDYEITDTTENIKDCNKFKFNYLASENVSAVENPTINGANVGIAPSLDTNGDFLPGSTFNIKVNDQDTDGSIFYVLSNDGEYVNLIAQQNITIDGNFTSEPQDNDEWYKLLQDNRYGPQTAYKYLSDATSNWTNIPIIESFNYLDEGNQINSSYGYKSIITKLNNKTGNYVTTLTPLSSDYGASVTYKNMRVRLPKYSEASEVGCISSSGSCPLWMVNYLYSSSYYTEENGKINSVANNYAYWLLTSTQGSTIYARYVFYDGYVSSNYANNVFTGIRPVITVLKDDLLNAMN